LSRIFKILLTPCKVIITYRIYHLHRRHILEQEIAKYFWSLKDSVFFDVFSLISGKLYIIITSSLFILYAIIRLKSKILFFIIATAISVAASDVISYRVLKPAVKRPRPAVELNLDRTKAYALKKQDDLSPSNNYSMPSNHASNAFAFFIVYYCIVRKGWWFALLNSILISASRIFIVKHYPTDVLAGVVLGIAIGLCVIYICSFFVSVTDISKNTNNN
jgi:membrane-associated phospholipid phosphatase